MEEQALKLMNIRPRILCEINDNVSRRYMLNKGLGNGFLPSYSIRPEDTFFTWSFQPNLSFYVVAACRKNTVLSEPMKSLLKLLLSHFQALT